MPRDPAAWAGVTIDCQDPGGTAAFWSALLDAPSRPAGVGRHGWYRIGPVVPGGPVLNFQPVAEAKQGKARLHLDLWVDELATAVARAEDLGAWRHGDIEVVPGRGSIAVMKDPEGNEFCLISTEGV